MKKLLSILIALSCLVLAVSCGDTSSTKKPPEIPVSEGGVSFSEFVRAATNTAELTASQIKISRTSDVGTLEAVLKTEYNTDGSFVIEYERERFGKIADGEGFKVTEAGAVECDKSGNYSDGGELVGNVIVSNAFALNLDEYKLNDAKIEGNILYATVFSADTSAVLGVDLGATALIAITISGGNITAASVSFMSDGSTVDVKCEYSY